MSNGTIYDIISRELTYLNNAFQVTRAKQQRVVSLATAITRTEDALSALRSKMRENRSKGRELYKALVFPSISSKLQSTSVDVTANESAEAQLSKRADTNNTTPIKQNETTSASSATLVPEQKATTTHPTQSVESIIEDTYVAEQQIAAQVQSEKLAPIQLNILNVHSHFDNLTDEYKYT